MRYLLYQRHGRRWLCVGEFTARSDADCDRIEGMRVYLWNQGIRYDAKPHIWSARPQPK